MYLTYRMTYDGQKEYKFICREIWYQFAGSGGMEGLVGLEIRTKSLE